MTSQFAHNSYDAIIIGARCAGAAAAMLLARSGARVLIVDRDTRMYDTLSTHALMRPAVSLLDHWGVLGDIITAQTPAIRRTQFIYGAERIDVPVKPAGNAEGLYAPRRWLLDRALNDAAVNAGAELHVGTQFVSVIKDDSGRVVGASLRQSDGRVCDIAAGIVIGADGRNSAVATAVDANILTHSPDCSATAYTYVDGVENEGYRWYFGDRLAAGLIPTNQGAHCLFTSCAPADFGRWFKGDTFAGSLKILATWEPELAARLAERKPVERMRRYPGAAGFIRECTGPGWALIGDAGYFKDPATAHGITDAFLDAHRLVRALIQTPDCAKAYQAERDQFAPRLFAITQKIASHQWDFTTLKSLHMDLNDCMKAENSALSAGLSQHQIAA